MGFDMMIAAVKLFYFLLSANSSYLGESLLWEEIGTSGCSIVKTSLHSLHLKYTRSYWTQRQMRDVPKSWSSLRWYVNLFILLNFASVVNNDTTIQAANYSLPLLNGEEFLWQLMIYGFVITDPFSNYLNQIINALDCSNASVQGNSLIFRRSGEEIFIVEITFNNLGIMDTILMKNMQNEVFYHITSSYPQNVVHIVLGVICGATLGLVGINVYLKRRQKKEIARNI
jgi:hypothetical protein